MEFPTLVYRCPGEHQRSGGTYTYRQVQDDEQLLAAMDDGWFVTLPEAIEGKHAAPAPMSTDLGQTSALEPQDPQSNQGDGTQAVQEGADSTSTTAIDADASQVVTGSIPAVAEAVTEDTTPPTRAELEQMAKEMGIRFDGRTSDKKLGDRIEAALKG